MSFTADRTDLDLRTQAFVDGAYVDAASGATFDCVNPARRWPPSQPATPTTATAPSPARGEPSTPARGRARRRSSASACCAGSPT